MASKHPIDRLFAALAHVGIPKSYVRRMLPEWWSDQLLHDPTAEVELDLSLARMFGLNLRDLMKDPPIATFDLPARTKYKRIRHIDSHDLEGATSLIHSVARMVAAAVPHPVNSPSNDPFEIRRDILERIANRVSLMGLVAYLWERGIPVIHLNQLPPGLKKMDGLCLKIDDRPVIVLSKNVQYQAWLLFIVAHELAHCAMQHIDANEILVDCTIGENSYLLADSDEEEISADRFALALLNGGYDIQYTSFKKPNSAQLADAAISYQEKEKVDAGHVILNYGHANNLWPIAQAALALIDKEDARKKVNAFLFQQLDLSSIPKSSVEYLWKITGMAASEETDEIS